MSRNILDTRNSEDDKFLDDSEDASKTLRVPFLKTLPKILHVDETPLFGVTPSQEADVPSTSSSQSKSQIFLANKYVQKIMLIVSFFSYFHCIQTCI